METNDPAVKQLEREAARRSAKVMDLRKREERRTIANAHRRSSLEKQAQKSPMAAGGPSAQNEQYTLGGHNTEQNQTTQTDKHEAILWESPRAPSGPRAPPGVDPLGEAEEDWVPCGFWARFIRVCYL
ncbi:hypothetical protein DPSP01_014300 [Paraphaeosphaeria sporulosa]